MLQRYLGNKSGLNGEIIRLIGEIAPVGAHVCDAFAGSLAVSAALKRRGFRVSSNDVNLLSWVYGVAYLQESSLPSLRLEEILGRRAAQRVGCDSGEAGASIDPELNAWRSLLSFLVRPLGRGELPRGHQRSDIEDHYCETGKRSSFISSRGSSGNRRFFTPSNAKAIDAALSRIRYWWRSGSIDLRTRCLLTACLLDGIERVANTQGTYHDFPRAFYDARALKPLSVPMPDLETLLAGPPAVAVGKGMDSLDFVKTLQPHSVLYLDPPYNFRQYTAYYFLPNLVAEYPEIESLDEYFQNVQFVRGQNMQSDFTSTFCSSKSFVSSLKQLIESARSDYVVLSYFNGRNHWNDFKSGTSDRGRIELENLFKSDLFEADSMRCEPIDRLNYQSYGGYKALPVSEYLFVAKRSAANKKGKPKREQQHALV